MISRYFNIVLIVSSAFAMGLSQHPMGLGFLSYCSLIPIIPTLIRLKSYKKSFKIGFLWGFVYNLVVVYWLAFNIGTSQSIAVFTMILSVFILSSCSVIIFTLWCALNRRGVSILAISIVWASAEYIRSLGSLGFPWTSIANSQLDFSLVLQNAEYTGMYGISFWIVLVNIILYKLIDGRDLHSLYRFVAVFSVPFITGWLILESYTEKEQSSIRVMTVQPNIHLSEKWKSGAQNKIISKIIAQTESNLDSTVDLVVWPETSTISYVLQNDRYNRDRILRMIQKTEGINLVAGIPFFEQKDGAVNHFNSSAYFARDGSVEHYHKIRLVPGAEYVPGSDFISSLSFFNFGQGSFSHGTEYKLFSVNDYKFASGICLESTFPSLSRSFVSHGANFLVYLVNDGWYETAPEPQQHSSRAVYRAIETRKPVVRCANTGISMVIDQFGNIQHQLELNKEGVIVSNIYPNSYKTFYVKYGDIFIYFMMVIIILSMFKSIRYEDYV